MGGAITFVVSGSMLSVMRQTQIKAALESMPLSVAIHLRDKGAIDEKGELVHNVALSEQLRQLAVPADIEKLVELGVVTR